MRVLNKKRLKLVIRVFLAIFFIGYGVFFIADNSSGMRDWYSQINYEEQFLALHGVSYEQWQIKNKEKCLSLAKNDIVKANANNNTMSELEKTIAALGAQGSESFENCIKPIDGMSYSDGGFYIFTLKKMFLPSLIYAILSIVLMLFIPFFLVDTVPAAIKKTFNWMTEKE